jgi:hypothetical protein
LVYVDYYHESNRHNFAELSTNIPFRIKHVPVHENHRYWLEQGLTFIAGAKNTAIIHAEGKLLVTFDDAELFPPHLLQTLWDHYINKRYVLVLHKRVKSLKTTNGLPDIPIAGSIYQTDHRWKNLKHPIPCPANWAYAGTTFSLKDALEVNGFNERMDGYKSLEDCEFGVRVSNLKRTFVVDPKAYLYIVDHQSYSDDNKIQQKIIVENHAMVTIAKNNTKPKWVLSSMRII